MLELREVNFYYSKYQPILENLNLRFEKGKFYVILGQSGCGKTTLLSLLGGLALPKSGKILYHGEEISQKTLENHRKNNVAFIFQNYNLIEYMTALENVCLSAKKDSAEALDMVGISPEEKKRNVLKLSVGQQQRVAVAKALASDKPIILGDEPTGNLDEKNAMEMIGLLKKSAHEHGRCVIVVTHSMKVAKEADIIFEYANHRFHKKEKENEIPKAEIDFELQEWQEEDTDVIRYFRKERQENEKKIYAVIAREKIIGSVELVLEKGIYQKNAQMKCWLLSAYHGKHIMSEAIWRVCGKVFRDTALTRIYVEPCTKDSILRRVLEKNGFELEGILKNRIYQDGIYQDACIYAKIKKDQ